MGLERAIIALATALPRGGHSLTKLLRPVFPGLRHYPAKLKSSTMTLRGDVGLNVFYPLAVHGYYTHQTVEDDVIAWVARDARAIADVGGNIGYITALMATAAPAAKIVAFEPLPLCQPYLAQVATHYPGVSVIAKAVGAEPGTAEFSLRSRVDRSSFSGSGDTNAELLQVPVTTLDIEMAGQDVDLIKIDVEGFEDVVLAGAHETVTRCRPFVVFEAYETDVLRRVLAFFDKVGGDYAIYRIAENGALRLLADHERQDDETCNFVAWPPHRPLPDGLRVPASYKRP